MFIFLFNSNAAALKKSQRDITLSSVDQITSEHNNQIRKVATTRAAVIKVTSLIRTF